MMIELTVYAWYGDYKIGITIPNEWEVKVCKMKGHNAPMLTKDQICEKLERPIKADRLCDLVGKKKKCVILVDDLTRPTKAYQIIPFILKELKGMEDIRFVMAIGSHHWMRLDDIKKKLGEDIPERYNVFNHNVYENCVFIGKTSYDTPIYINKEVMKCDLKIGVGCIIPHFGYGYGGGSKIILPGVSHIDTIYHNHNITKGVGIGCMEGNFRRLDAEEAASMANLDFIVNVLVNPNRDCCELVCGEPKAAHKEGVKMAKDHYITETIDADIVIVNGYPIENEAYKALDIVKRSLKDGGDVVLLMHTLEGLRGHYYAGRFGTDYGGRGWKGSYPHGLKEVYIVAPHSSLADHQYFGSNSKWFKSWDGALEILKKKYGNKKVKVAIYPYAPIQIAKEDALR